MLDRVSTIVFGLDGLGHAERFADYSQWDAWQIAQNAAFIAEQKTETKRPPMRPEIPSASTKTNLTHSESREVASLEKQIAKAEQTLRTCRAALENQEIASDASRLQVVFAEMEAAQKTVDSLYQRWSEFGQKKN